MEYRTSRPFSGNVSAALEVARSVFISNGFKVDMPNNTELVATGSGMTSSRQNPLLGVTSVKVTIGPASINLSATLGGVRWMRNFLFLFPLGLGVFLIILFALLSLPWIAFLSVLFAIMPWLILAPLFTGWIRRRTLRALDTLLYNMESAGQPISRLAD